MAEAHLQLSGAALLNAHPLCSRATPPGGSFFASRATVLEASPPLAITQTDIRRIDSEAFRLVARAHLSEDAAFALYERLARLEAAYLTRLQERGVLE